MAPRKKKKDVTPVDAESQPSIKSESPLVFISHDTRDADLAEAFGNLLTDASGGVLQSFRSSDRKGTAGIEFGAEWYAAIMSKLSNATDVVALLTTYSIERPWILYEAGVAKGKLDTTVLGLAVNIPLEKAASGPFAQFQNCADDEDSLTKLVLQLIRRNPLAQPREEAVRRQVQAFQSTIKAIGEKRKTPQSIAKADESPVAKMFEEVKILVRDLPERVSVQVQESPGRPRSFRKRLSSGLLEEILHLSFNRMKMEDCSPYLIMVFSLFRDELPWAYELGMEFARSFRTKSSKNIAGTYHNLRRAFEFYRKGPFREFGRADDESVYFLYRFVTDLEHLIPRRFSEGKPDEPAK